MVMCRLWKKGAATREALLSMGLVLMLAGCAGLPTPVVRPTGGPVFALSLTASPRPSHTRRPTQTPEPAETPTFVLSATPETVLLLTPTVPFLVLPSTPTPAVLFASSSPTPPAASELDCKLIWQSPPNGATYHVKNKFSVGWNIRNTGTATWQAGSFEFTYLDGAQLHNDDLVPLTANVAPGQTVVLSVPMKAPNVPNDYTTHWGIRHGDVFFCRLQLTISVQP